MSPCSSFQRTCCWRLPSCSYIQNPVKCQAKQTNQQNSSDMCWVRFLDNAHRPFAESAQSRYLRISLYYSSLTHPTFNHGSFTLSAFCPPIVYKITNPPPLRHQHKDNTNSNSNSSFPPIKFQRFRKWLPSHPHTSLALPLFSPPQDLPTTALILLPPLSHTVRFASPPPAHPPSTGHAPVLDQAPHSTRYSGFTQTPRLRRSSLLSVS